MDKITLLLVLLGLLIVLIVLVAIYVSMQRKSKPIEPEESGAVTFKSLQAIIAKASTSNQELNSAVDILLEQFNKIDEGKQAFTYFAGLIEKLCTHPNTDSKMILRFQKGLIVANPRYKDQIEKTLKLGLSERK
ncbi:MAG: hypothetical protein WC680_05550 [Sulfuricurvum sp.]|jgi:hypothetical protein